MTSESASTGLGLQSGADRGEGADDPAPPGMGGSCASGSQAVLQQLSEEERSALAALAHDPPRQSVPRHCAVRLLKLGLADLDCGRLLLTGAGRNAAAGMTGQQGSGAAKQTR